MKKAVALLLTLGMTASLAACKGTPAASTAPASSGSDAAGTGKKIALVTDKVGTQVFLTQMVDGLHDAAEQYGFEATVAECADDAAYEENIRALVAEGYDLIIGGGWQAGGALQKVATEFPDASSYALIDSEIEAENVKCISYREQEGAYLIGMLGAFATKGESHVYGAVHCFEGPGSWKYRYGFMQGVLAVDPEATFVFNFTGSFSDPAKAKEFAIQQFEQGAKFINSAAAGGDSGTFEAAKEKGFYTSGQDVDLTDPENPYILSSQLKDTYYTVRNLIDEYFSDHWTTENAVWGLEENTIGAVYITHDSKNPRSDRLSDEDVATIKKAAEDIKSGALDLTVPDEETYKQ